MQEMYTNYEHLIDNEELDNLVDRMVALYTSGFTFDEWCEYGIECICIDIRTDVEKITKVVKDITKCDTAEYDIKKSAYRTIESIAYRIDNRVFKTLHE